MIFQNVENFTQNQATGGSSRFKTQPGIQGLSELIVNLGQMRSNFSSTFGVAGSLIGGPVGGVIGGAVGGFLDQKKEREAAALQRQVQSKQNSLINIYDDLSRRAL